MCRHSSTTASKSRTSYNIPPESPKFIDIPRSLQAQAVPEVYQKGILPRPREVHGRKSRKALDAYISQTAPEPTRRRDAELVPKDTRDRMDWKQRVAASRRRNLREGLVELKTRKDRTDRHLAAKSAQKQADYDRRVHAPDPDDVRFTATTVLQIANEDAAARKQSDLEQRRAKYQRLQEAKEEDRRYALHELYTNARNFIIDEAALDKKIEEVFDTGFYKGNPARGVWDEQGVPETAKWMLDYRKDKGKRAIDNVNTPIPVEISKQRQQRMAEELTGGKI